jgi:hypothetical protein
MSLTACGGNGGDATASSVMIGAPTPSAITYSTFTGMSLPVVDLQGSVTGDADSLQEITPEPGINHGTTKNRFG